MTTKIDLTLPRQWNACSTEQLELIADVIREQVERTDRYHQFSMQNVKIALFFALSGIEVVAGPNPSVPVEDQYYTCRLSCGRSWRGRIKSIFTKSEDDSFSLYLWQINYWLSKKANTNDKKSAEYVSQGAGVLDWLDNENGVFLTKFPYNTIRRQKSGTFAPGAKESFSGPLTYLDGFSWSQYRLATETMQNYVQLSNSLAVMKQRGTFSDEQMQKQAHSVDMAKSLFLATIFNRKVKFIDTSTGILRKDYHYQSNQITDNAEYFRNFPDTKWQVILFWWTGIMHQLSKRYPHVFKVQKVGKKQQPSSAMDIYTATIATMQKYVGINEQDCNNQSYSLVLEQLERMSKESEELERIRKNK